MKTILCYGDSNTWGSTPGSGERFAKYERWPGVLQKELGAEYEIIEEGLSGRTTVWDDAAQAACTLNSKAASNSQGQLLIFTTGCRSGRPMAARWPFNNSR